jgi:cytochrome c peroxidase
MLFGKSTWIGRAIVIGSILPIIGGCSANNMDGFSNEDWQRVTAIAPLATPMPPNPFDAQGDNDAIARFGQRLFFDKRGADAIIVDGPSGKAAHTMTDPVTGMPIMVPGEEGRVSCATCHGSTYLADPRPFPVSHGRSWLAHNTPTMANLGYLKSVLWTGRFDSLREHGTGATAQSTALGQIHFIYNFHRDEYNAVFPNTPLDPALDPTEPDAARFPTAGNPKTATTVNGQTVMAADGAFEKMAPADRWAVYQFKGNMGVVFEAHPRKLNTPGSKFERYVHAEDSSALSDSAKNGLRLFIGKASCIDCHNGPALSDGLYHNIGVPTQTYNPPAPYSTTAGVPDRGRGGTLVAGLNNQLMVLRTNAMLAPMDQVPLFGGAGQFSDDPGEGLKRLVAQDTASCTTRSSDPADVTAACQALFFPGSPEDTTKTPPVPAKPADLRLDTCIAANTASGADICTAYDSLFEGAFRTPILLNIAETAPYFHTGDYATLTDVVNYYNQGGGAPGTFLGTKSAGLHPLGLTETEVADLVEFLKTLTGNPPDPNWMCDPALPPAAAGVAAVAGGPCAAAP